MDALVARAVLEVLAGGLPADADVERVAVHEIVAGRIVVTVSTSTPGPVVGRRGGVAVELRDRLRAAAPGCEVELRVHEGVRVDEPGRRLAGTATADTGPRGHDLVPDLVGMTVEDARDKARSSGFSLATGDPDSTPISFYASRGGWRIVSQAPAAGALAPLHSAIVVEVEEGGGGESGDREPRVPHPPGGLAHAEEHA